MKLAHFFYCLLLVLASFSFAGCGIKGDPLPPKQVQEKDLR